MAEEFHGGVCGGTWWNPPLNMFSSGSTNGWLSPCSVAQFGGGLDVTNFGWSSEPMKGNGLVSDMMINSMVNFPCDFDSTFGFGLSPTSSTTDWNQSNLICDVGSDEENFGLILQEDNVDSKIYCEMNTSSPTIMMMNSNNLMNSQDGSPSIALTTSSNNSEDSSTINNELISNLNSSFPLDSSASYLIQTLFDDIDDSQLVIDSNYGEHMSSNELVNEGQASNGQYLDDTTLRNIQASLLNSLLSRSRGSKSKNKSNNCANLVTKVTNDQEICDSNGNLSEQPPAKRPRIETPSPLPSFKVRKEKLGDRITALQQLVSPFGKTDTASVLHEAIEYIKFLHDQVNALSSPYMENGAPIQNQQDITMLKKKKNEHNQDLRSQGLCLMPISSTYPIAQETSVDFWTPTFGANPLL